MSSRGTTKRLEPEQPARQLRADARRNRERLLAAADEVFSERGADASMDDVARRAGVGIGTLYRHFPTREALLAATVEDSMLVLARKGQSSMTTTSPVQALASFLEAIAEHARTYKGLAASLGVVLQSGGAGCTQTSETCRHLLAEAQAAGEIRRDVDFDDLVCVVTAIALAAQETTSDSNRVRRLVAMFVDGLRPQPPRVARARRPRGPGRAR